MYCWASAWLFAIFLWAVYIWRKKTFSLFKDLGIPGPEPSLLFGHLLQIRRRGAAILFEEWIQKYGNIVGFYNGARPFLLVNDLEILKKVQIEDFHNFSTRGGVTSLTPSREFEGSMVINARGSHWKRQRTVLSPAFSPKKISLMAGAVLQCTDTLINVLKEKCANGESLEVTLPIRLATMDTMLKVAYGVDMNVQRSPPGGSLEEVATGITRLLKSVPLQGLSFLSNCFPELDSFWALLTWIESILVVPYFKLVERVIQPVVDQRRLHQTHSATDFLQLLVNSESTGELFAKDNQTLDISTKVSLTKQEVNANAALFLVAGLEGTTILLSSTLYSLGLHTDIQDKVRFEVLGVLKKKGRFTYESTIKMTYVDMVLNEAMRMYSAALGFSPENISLIDKASFQPFGLGPRQCLGRNFALMQARLTLCKIISTFKISVDKEHHMDPLKMESALVASTIPDGVWLKFEKISM